MLHITTEEIESMDAPGILEWAIGVGVGVLLGAGAVALT